MTSRHSLSVSARRTGAAIFAAAALLAAGAAAQEGPWLGDSLGLSRPAMIPIGRTPMVDPNGRAADALSADPQAVLDLHVRDGREVPAEGGVRQETISLIALNAVTGETYRVEAPRAAFERLHLEMVMRGETSPSRVEEAPVEERGRQTRSAAAELQPIAERSWSDGVESIFLFGIGHGYPANHNTFSRIGQIDWDCTGSLIGSRHVLTAAHCLVDNRTQVGYNRTFRPRRDNTIAPYPGEPYGARDFVWYYFPDRYWDGTCNVNSTTACNKYDIAIGILSSNVSAPYMGYGYQPVSVLDTYEKRMRGYLRYFYYNSQNQLVVDPETPNLAMKYTLAGDSADCDIEAWASPDGDNWNRELFVTCDGVRGMDGAAMYTPDIYQSGPVALGVYSESLCLAAACATHPEGAHPNVYTRVTPEYAQLISMAKSLWYCASGTCP